MLELDGILTFADGSQIADLLVMVYETPSAWNGNLLILEQYHDVVAEVFRQHQACELFLEDGRSGMIQLTRLGGMIRFDGIGPLVRPTLKQRQIYQSA